MKKLLPRGAAGLATVVIASAGVTGCGSEHATTVAPAVRVVTAPLATSLVTTQGTWAITAAGGSAQSEESFWQLLVRPTGATRWSLVTPPGIATNGGLAAAGGGAALLVGIGPNQGLGFSPLATSTDDGKSWSQGVLGSALAEIPDSLSVGPSGQALALLEDGTIESSRSAAGSWSRLTTLTALAASAAGRSCGLVGINAISLGINETPVAAGSCSRPGVAGVFTDTNGTWQADGPALPRQYGGYQVRVLRLSGGSALVAAGSSLFAAWQHNGQWTVSAPLTGAGQPRASGFGAGGSAWVLTGNGGAGIVSGTGGGWQRLPAVPAGTAVLAPAATGTGSDGYQALAVSGALLTVWQLTAGNWVKVQSMKVPVQYGSSG